LMTQTFIIHIIRTAGVPFIDSRASTPLIATTVLIVTIGALIPYTFIGGMLGFEPLPALYWPLVTVMMLAYAAMTQVVKDRFARRWGM